jgi:predicted dinucleotide-binding enzyme
MARNMKIGIIGSAMVAQILGKKLAELGHEILISSRDVNKDKGYFPSASTWANNVKDEGYKTQAGTFSNAAQFGEVILNCTNGAHSIEALEQAGEQYLSNKILIDIANPLDFSGDLIALTVLNTDSLGERIQRRFPKSRVVKALNTVNVEIMINPHLLDGPHDLFISGNDSEAKKWVREVLLHDWLGWEYIIDLGDIKGSRMQEMYLPLWIRLYSLFNSAHFNIHVVRKNNEG